MAQVREFDMLAWSFVDMSILDTTREYGPSLHWMFVYVMLCFEGERRTEVKFVSECTHF